MHAIVRFLVIVVITYSTGHASIANQWQSDSASHGAGNFIFLAVAIALSTFGAFGTGLLSLALGCVSSALLGIFWTNSIPISADTFLLITFVATFVYLIFLASRPTFSSGELRIHDGGDHLTVDIGDGTVHVFRSGRVLCEEQAETKSITKWGGGSRVVPTTSTVTTYGPNGVGFGTVHGSQVVDYGPVFSYEVEKNTGRTKFSLEEVGPDHAVLVADRPKNVFIEARHKVDHREKYGNFTLSSWGSARFALWRKLHAKSFFRKDPTLPKKISKATSQHLAEMTKTYGKTSVRQFFLTEELDLLLFIGLSKSKIYVYLARHYSITIEQHNASEYWKDGKIIFPNKIWIKPDAKIAAKLSEWSQVHELRQNGRS